MQIYKVKHIKMYNYNIHMYIIHMQIYVDIYAYIYVDIYVYIYVDRERFQCNRRQMD